MSKCSSVEYAYQMIKELIVRRELLPGQQIVETAMSNHCGISRTPVREAIRLLEREGLVEIIPHKGSFLRHITKDEVIMGYEAGAALEGMAVYLIAEKIHQGILQPDDLREAYLYMEEMENAYKKDDIKSWATADENFHASIMKIAANEMIESKRKEIRLQINQVLWFITPSIIDKEISNQEHRACFEMMIKGDKFGAQATALSHRLQVRDTLRDIL